MQMLKFKVRDERGEFKVAALAGDFEILQGLIVLAQSCECVGHVKGRTGAVVERFPAGVEALLK